MDPHPVFPVSMAAHQKPHVAVVPFPAIGHYIPLLELSRVIASQGIRVSYVATPANASRLQDFVNDAVNCGMDLRLALLPTPPVEGLPEGIESSDVCPPESHGSIFALAKKLKQPFDAWMEPWFQEKKPDAPVCIVFDSFMEWARESAEEFKISCVEFPSCGAFAVSCTNSAARSALQAGRLEKDGEEDVVLSLDLPRPLRFKRSEISEDYWNADEMNPITMLLLPMLQIVGKGGSSGLILNTFEELQCECEYLEHLTGKPVWAIGPLLPTTYFNVAANKVSTRGKTADIDAHELVRWLDSQKTGSVVYVSFGSVINLSKEQLKALARGLESSQQPFVWAIKTTKSTRLDSELNQGRLPEGFLERTKERGMVIWGWAPQLLILSHASVGAFLNHCGTNSTLESLSLGVPIAGWPMFGDHFFNMKMLTQLGVGIQLCEQMSGFPDEKKVREVLREMLGDGKGKEMRMAAQKIRDMARKAVGEGGSSNGHVQGFASEMRKLREMRQQQSTSLMF